MIEKVKEIIRMFRKQLQSIQDSDYFERHIAAAERDILENPNNPLVPMWEKEREMAIWGIENLT